MSSEEISDESTMDLSSENTHLDLLNSPNELTYAKMEDLNDNLELQETTCSTKKEVAQRWMEMIIGEKVSNDFIEALKSGVYLCMLINRLYAALGMKDASIISVSSTDHLLNIKTYLRASSELGVKDEDSFEPNDLLEAKRPEKIISNILALQSAVTEKSMQRSPSNSTLSMLELAASMIRQSSTRDLRSISSREAFVNTEDDDDKNKKKWEEILEKYHSQQRDIYMHPEEGIRNIYSKRGQGAKAYSAWCTEEKIRMLIRGSQDYGPLPTSLHGKLWMLLSGAQKELDTKVGFYDSISLSPFYGEDNEVTRQIDVDIRRTISSEDQENWDEENMGELRRVLLAYSVYNQKLGYCQGLNFVVARMLQYIKEEEAFWLLVQMINLLPDDYYTTMLGVAIDQHVFVDLVDLRHPEINAHLRSLGGSGMELSLACTEWFLTLFASPCPKDVTVRVWDALFINGDEVLFQVALALMTIQSDKILECSIYSDILSCLNDLGSVCVDPDELIEVAWKHDIVNRSRIEDLRAHHRLHLATGIANSTTNSERPTKASSTEKRTRNHKRGRKFFPSTNLNNREKFSNKEARKKRISYRSEFIRAFYLDGVTPKIIENYWSSRTMDMQWEVTSHKQMDHASQIAEKEHPSGQDALYSHMKGRRPPSHSQHSSHNSAGHLSWIQKIEEWHKDKKMERIQKVKQQRELKRMKKQQKFFEKQQKKNQRNNEMKSSEAQNLDDQTLVELQRQIDEQQMKVAHEINVKREARKLEGMNISDRKVRAPVRSNSPNPRNLKLPPSKDQRDRRKDQEYGIIEFPGIEMPALIRRHVSAPSVDSKQTPSVVERERGNSLLRERAHIVSYLQRKASDASSRCATPTRTPVESPYFRANNSFSSDHSYSFLDRLSFDIECFIDQTTSSTPNQSPDGKELVSSSNSEITEEKPSR